MVEGVYPQTRLETLKLRRDLKETLLIAGGTDIMVVKKRAAHMIFINQVKDLQKTILQEDRLILGAAATYGNLLADAQVPAILKQAMKNIASPAIRNAGTVGGNICNASPAGDMLPVLYALSAVIVKSKITVEDRVEEIRLPIEDFILGIRKIALMEDEVVTAIEIPRASYEAMSKISYEKVGARQADAISKLSFIGLMKVENATIFDIRIAFGSVSVTTVRRKELEHEMIGKTILELQEMKSKILETYAEYIRPINDQRSTAVYRKKVCMNLLEEFLTV